jgi:hypothetical protein
MSAATIADNGSCEHGRDALDAVRALLADQDLDLGGARYLQWDWDPDPQDERVVTDDVFVVRGADGRSEVVHETHETGLFQASKWWSLLTHVGFDATAERERTDDDRTPRTIFVADRPATGASDITYSS